VKSLTAGLEKGKPLDELDARALIIELIHEVQTLNQKFDLVIEFGGKILKTQKEFLQKTIKQNKDITFKLKPDIMTLLSLPTALRKTVMAVYKLGKGTAEDLAHETKRLRPVESSTANELVRMGLLAKKREGRKVVFFIE
jgi:hypothetical protein